MDKLSIVIVAKDEEENLKELLPSLKWADERIVLVDDRSTDSTYKIAKELGARVENSKFENFGQFKNKAITMSSGTWVLLLDSDERLTEELVKEIQTVIKSDKASGYLIPFKNYLGGKWLRFGGLHPDYHLRLFRKENFKIDGEVHEIIRVNGQVGRLKNSILHYTYKDFRDLKDKVNLYSLLEARSIGRATKPWEKYYRSLAKFVRVYILLGGFLDGWIGFLHASEKARYQWRVYR